MLILNKLHLGSLATTCLQWTLTIYYSK